MRVRSFSCPNLSSGKNSLPEAAPPGSPPDSEHRAPGPDVSPEHAVHLSYHEEEKAVTPRSGQGWQANELAFSMDEHDPTFGKEREPTPRPGPKQQDGQALTLNPTWQDERDRFRLIPFNRPRGYGGPNTTENDARSIPETAEATLDLPLTTQASVSLQQSEPQIVLPGGAPERALSVSWDGRHLSSDDMKALAMSIASQKAVLETLTLRLASCTKSERSVGLAEVGKAIGSAKKLKDLFLDLSDSHFVKSSETPCRRGDSETMLALRTALQGLPELRHLAVIIKGNDLFDMCQPLEDVVHPEKLISLTLDVSHNYHIDDYSDLDRRGAVLASMTSLQKFSLDLSFNDRTDDFLIEKIKYLLINRLQSLESFNLNIFKTKVAGTGVEYVADALKSMPNFKTLTICLPVLGKINFDLAEAALDALAARGVAVTIA